MEKTGEFKAEDVAIKIAVDHNQILTRMVNSIEGRSVTAQDIIDSNLEIIRSFYDDQDVGKADLDKVCTMIRDVLVHASSGFDRAKSAGDYLTVVDRLLAEKSVDRIFAEQIKSLHKKVLNETRSLSLEEEARNLLKKARSDEADSYLATLKASMNFWRDHLPPPIPGQNEGDALILDEFGNPVGLVLGQSDYVMVDAAGAVLGARVGATISGYNPVIIIAGGAGLGGGLSAARYAGLL